MNHREEETQSLFGARFAVSLCAVLLVGLAVSGILAMLDKRSRASLEKFEEPQTALTDHEHFNPDQVKQAGDVAVRFEGKELRVVSKDRVRADDLSMTIVGRDASGKYNIYRSNGSAAPDSLYLKLDRNEFLELKRN